MSLFGRQSAMSDAKMVVGLGNPGRQYTNTRHNTGFKVIDLLAETLKVDVKKRKFGARLGTGEYSQNKLILLKPWRYMNLSGQVVATAVGFYRLALQNLLVVTDDLALEPGRIRLRAKGTAGGHNGLADIIDKLGTNGFARCRVGIGGAYEGVRQNQVDYVLSKPGPNQTAALGQAIEKARDAVLCWVEHGIDTAMNQFNRNIE